MNRNSSAWTGRASRTMAEAFGPHTNRRLHPMPEPTRCEVWVVAVCVVAVVIGLWVFA